MDGIEELPSGNYRVRPWNSWWFNPKTGRNGRREPGYSKMFPADQLDQAKRYRDQCVSDFRRMYGPNSPGLGNITVGELLDRWLMSRAYDEDSTRYQEESVVRQLKAYFVDVHIAQLTADDIRLWVRRMNDPNAHKGKPFARQTQKARLSVLRRALDIAVEQKVFDPPINPAFNIHIPRQKHRPKAGRVIRPDELQLVVKAAHPRIAAGFILAHDTGMRLSEICGLEWRNVDLDGEWPDENGDAGIPGVWVQDVILQYKGTLRDYPKGKVPGWSPIRQETVDALREHREQFPPPQVEHAKVFHSNAGSGRYCPATVEKHWRNARRAAGLPEGVRLHDLRTTTASELTAAFIPPGVGRDMLHQKDDRTFLGYAQTSPRRVLAEANRQRYARAQ